MKIIIIADNLGGGSAVLGRAIISDIANKIGWHRLIILGNDRLELTSEEKTECFHYSEITPSAVPRIYKRYNFVNKITERNVVLNLSNFPIGTSLLTVEKEICLLHNAYFFSTPTKIRALGLRFILRDIIARRMVLFFMIMISKSSRTEFIVQTPWMKNLSRKLVPFWFSVEDIRLHGWPSIFDTKKRPYIFSEQIIDAEGPLWFYPATGEPHKNHVLLFHLFSEALKINSNIKLVVTLPPNNSFTPELEALLQQLSIQDSVKNVGWLDEKHKNQLMAISTGIIFLSNFESLGIPLLEIRESNKRALVIKSDASEYILGSDAELFDLMSDNLEIRQAHRDMFIKALTIDGSTTTYPQGALANIAESYLFDWIESEAYETL